MSRWTSGPSSSLRKYAAAVPPMPAPMMATLGVCLRPVTPYQVQSSSKSCRHVAGHAVLQSMPVCHRERVRMRFNVSGMQLPFRKLGELLLAGFA